MHLDSLIYQIIYLIRMELTLAQSISETLKI